MKFGIIKPAQRSFEVAEAATFEDAYGLAGLRPGEIDHGVVSWRISIAVYEYGLFDTDQHYFTIGARLFAGPALLYAFDENNRGETIDFVDADARLIQVGLRFFRSAAEVELAIAKGTVERPVMAVNDKVIWTWPQPSPAGMGERT